jgi:transposase InsO family protein
MRRQVQRQHVARRAAEQSARRRVATACQSVTACGAPVIQVTRYLALSDRTARRWRRQLERDPAPRGRPPQCATREERNLVYQFLKDRGASTPLVAVRAAFPQLRRADIGDLLRRFRRVTRRRAQQYQSRLEWRRAGAVWAADFKERREPLEGRYGWILSIKDLASGFQLTWQPLAEATATAVRTIYTELFAEHGPPLVIKSDNGGQFKADEIKGLLAEYRVIPLYSPKRHPQYNGGVERANGQLASYQEAVAQARRRPAGPTCDDAERARQLANGLAHPLGWRGPAAQQIWDERAPLTLVERAEFMALVVERRNVARDEWQFAPNADLTHDQAAAIDRRAVRDALVTRDMLHIHPRRRRALYATSRQQMMAHSCVGAGTMEKQEENAPSMVGGELDGRQLPRVRHSTEEAHSSAINPPASGKN